MMSRRYARTSPAIRGEIPRRCRGGSNSLTDPALCSPPCNCKVTFGIVEEAVPAQATSGCTLD